MSVLTVTQAKTHLNLSSAVSDAELQTFIDAAEAAIAEKCGPLAATATTERVKSTGGPMLLLRTTPIISLTSVTPIGGSAYDVTLMEPDLSAGTIEWRSGASFAAGWYSVVTSAGRASVPADLLLGIKELVRHAWKSQRGGGRHAARDADELSNTLLASVHTWPGSVTSNIGPHLQVGN